MPLLFQNKDWDDLTHGMRQIVERLQADRLRGGQAWHPPVDIYETPDAVVLVMEVAGMSSQDLKVMVEDQVVTIYGHRNPPCKHSNARFHRLEIQSGPFTRSFRLTRPIHGPDSTANILNGMLYIIVPKDLTISGRAG